MAVSVKAWGEKVRAGSPKGGRWGFAFRLLLVLGIWPTGAWILWIQNRYHTNMGTEMAILLAMTLLVYLMGQVPLDWVSGLLLFPMLTLEILFSYRAPYVVVLEPVRALFLLLDIILLLWCQTGHIRRYVKGLILTGLAGALFSVVSDVLLTKLLPLYYRLGRTMGLNPLEKAGLLALAALGMLGAYVLGLRLAAGVLGPRRQTLEEALERFRELEPFLLLLEIFAILLWYTLEYVSFLGQINSFHFLSGYSNLSLILLLLLNICYIVLLAKAASINRRMQIAREDRRLLAAYNSELEDTMDSLHEIRHDVKNLLLTMGGFVERSQDDQMKEFYQKNIVPFIEHALIKNDLQNKLRILKDDCLKSFLYYKIIEITERGTGICLEVSSPVSLEWGCGDVIRLLGIFIDNAAEETAQAGGEVRLEILDTEEGIRFVISNPVRPEIRERGVMAGTTDKGLGRGNGLVIAGKIIAGYENILLNSYFTEYGFTQSLLIAKQGTPYA